MTKLLAPPGYVKTTDGVFAPSKVVADALQKARRARAGNGGYWSSGTSAFDAADTTRWTDDFFAPEVSPVELVGRYQRLMVNRARALSRNAPWMVSIRNAWVDNVVGDGKGWQLRAKSYDDELGEELATNRNKRTELLFRRWRRRVDPSRREDLNMFFRTAEAEYADVGEYFVERVRLRDGLALKLIPSERLDPTYDRPARMVTFGGAPLRQENRITHGIEFDANGVRIAYHFDDVDADGLPNGSLPKVVIPAGRIDHRFLKLRADFERGIPPIHAALMLLKDLDDAFDYELEGWKAQSRVVGALKRETAGVFPAGVETDVEDDREIIRIDGAAFLDLKPTEDVELPTPTRPNAKLEPFVTIAMRALGRTVGFSYEAISGDFSKVNFASGRLGDLQDQRTIGKLQHELTHLNLDPLFEDWLFGELAALGISPADFIQDPERYTEHVFIPPGRKHHDPGKEVVAAALRILVGLSTLEQETAALGGDWLENLKQQSKELAARVELGVPLFNIGGTSLATGRGNEALETDETQNSSAGTSPALDEDEDDDDDDDQAGRLQASPATTAGVDMSLILSLLNGSPDR